MRIVCVQDDKQTVVHWCTQHSSIMVPVCEVVMCWWHLCWRQRKHDARRRFHAAAMLWE